MTDDQNLGSAFGDKGTKANQIAYGHPYAENIIDSAREVLNQSETGKTLLKVRDTFKIPVHIIKGNGESGYSPEMNTIFIQTSGNTQKATGEIILNFIKALREADQEYAGHKAPDPLKDVIAYAGFMHARNLDAITHICKVVKELTNSSYFSDLLDTLPKLGLNRVYKAYIDGASKEQLYMEYAEAYNEQRGSKH